MESGAKAMGKRLIAWLVTLLLSLGGIPAQTLAETIEVVGSPDEAIEAAPSPQDGAGGGEGELGDRHASSGDATEEGERASSAVDEADGMPTEVSDKGVDKKYYFEEDGTLVTGCWRDIDTGQGYMGHYYFRPSGSMATGWATIDGEKHWFRPSGNMATGWADVDDAYKRYFDSEGHMLTGWQTIGGKTYYFRPSGAMQTGTATIDGRKYQFSDKGVLVS